MISLHLFAQQFLHRVLMTSRLGTLLHTLLHPKSWSPHTRTVVLHDLAVFGSALISTGALYKTLHGASLAEVVLAIALAVKMTVLKLFPISKAIETLVADQVAAKVPPAVAPVAAPVVVTPPPTTTGTPPTSPSVPSS